MITKIKSKQDFVKWFLSHPQLLLSDASYFMSIILLSTFPAEAALLLIDCGDMQVIQMNGAVVNCTSRKMTLGPWLQALFLIALQHTKSTSLGIHHWIYLSFEESCVGLFA